MIEVCSSMIAWFVCSELVEGQGAGLGCRGRSSKFITMLRTVMLGRIYESLLPSYMLASP